MAWKEERRLKVTGEERSGRDSTATVKDAVEVRVTASAGPMAKRSLQPGTAGPDGELDVNAFLVHQYMLGQAQRDGAEELEGVEDGATWVLYRGTLWTAVAELHIAGTGQDSSAGAHRLRRDLSTWLSRHGCAVCLSYSAGGPSATEVTWAVRTEFRQEVVSAGMIHLEKYRRIKPGEVMSGRTLIGSTGGGDSGSTRLPCPYCRQMRSAMYLTRHVAREHLDAPAFLVEAIQQRGEIQSTDLAALLSEAAGGGPVTTSYVRRLLEGITDAPGSLISTVHGFAGDYRYTCKQQPAAASEQPQPQSSRVIEAPPVRLAGSSELPAAATAPPAEPPEEEWQPAPLPALHRGLIPVPASLAGSPPAASPAEAAASADDVDEAVAALVMAADRLRAVIRRQQRELKELKELREYRARVQSLLGNLGSL